jgi:hypothetical protein
MLILMAAGLAANCGDDSSGSSGGDGGVGPGGSGTIDDAGEPGSGATTSGGMPGSGDAGSSADAGSGTTPGGAPSSGGAAAGGAGGADGVSVCPAAIADFPTVYAEAVCRKRVECCQDTTDACMTELSAAMDEIFPDLAEAGQDGTATASCSSLELCVAAIDAADCADWPKELGTTYGLPVAEPACRGFIKGTVAPTDECSSTYQCDNGLCNDGDGAGGAGATCLALVADGQPCSGNNICNFATSYCNADTDLCAPRLANGVACTASSQCQSRICDTADTDTCVAPSAAQCEYVPEGCSLGRRPVKDSLGWSLVAIALVLGAGTRRRLRRA